MPTMSPGLKRDPIRSPPLIYEPCHCQVILDSTAVDVF